MPRGVKRKRQASNQPEQQTGVRDTTPATTEANASRADDHSNTRGRNGTRGVRNGSGSTGTDENGTSSNNGGQNGESSGGQRNESSGGQNNESSGGQSNESSGGQSSESSGGRSRENSGGQLATALTRDDIPVLVREISRQLRPSNPEVHAPLVPGKYVMSLAFICVKCLGPHKNLGGSYSCVDTPGLRAH